MRWGATRSEWQFFIEHFPGRLRPVVCNPSAIISSRSTLKKIGKTPSRYDPWGTVIGMPEWTSKAPSAEQLRGFARQPDYGICVCTGDGLAAFDIDIEVKSVADEIENILFKVGCRGCCVRYRRGSPRRLILGEGVGSLRKRVASADRKGVGVVELLGKGQQFVAAGTHESGSRYEWREIQQH